MTIHSLALLVVVALLCPACETAPRPPRSSGLVEFVQGASDSEPEVATAKEGPKLDTFSLRVGGQAIANFATTFRLDSDALGRGTEVRLENDLGFDEATEFGRLDAAWRFNRSHAVEVSYFAFSRRASRRLTKQIQWGDRTYDIDTEIYAIFQSDVLKAAYRYTFLGGEDWELGASLGVHGTRIRTAVGIAGSQLSAGEELSAIAPLPVVGLRGTWELGDDFRLNGMADLFYVKLSGVSGIDEIEGFLADVLVTAEYDLTENLALGVGANYFTINANVGSDRLRLSAEYDYFGGLVFGRLSF